MPVAFTIRVPLDGRFRDLVSEVAGKYAELSGGTKEESLALATSVVEQVARIAGERAEPADVELAFAVQNGRIDVTLRADGEAATVQQALLARKT